VISGEPLEVDFEATAKLRSAIHRDRIGKPQYANGNAHPHTRYPGIVRAKDEWACGTCGISLGPVAENAKDACSQRYRPLAEAGPLIAPHSGGESKKFRLSEYSCPNCATLLAVDQTLKTTETRWHDVKAV
jgi:ribosomal protein S27AE